MSNAWHGVQYIAAAAGQLGPDSSNRVLVAARPLQL
jgi:hypothetical protein